MHLFDFLLELLCAKSVSSCLGTDLRFKQRISTSLHRRVSRPHICVVLFWNEAAQASLDRLYALGDLEPQTGLAQLCHWTQDLFEAIFWFGLTMSLLGAFHRVLARLHYFYLWAFSAIEILVRLVRPESFWIWFGFFHVQAHCLAWDPHAWAPFAHRDRYRWLAVTNSFRPLLVLVSQSLTKHINRCFCLQSKFAIQWLFNSCSLLLLTWVPKLTDVLQKIVRMWFCESFVLGVFIFLLLKIRCIRTIFEFYDACLFCFLDWPWERCLILYVFLWNYYDSASSSNSQLLPVDVRLVGPISIDLAGQHIRVECFQLYWTLLFGLFTSQQVVADLHLLGLVCRIFFLYWWRGSLNHLLRCLFRVCKPKRPLYQSLKETWLLRYRFNFGANRRRVRSDAILVRQRRITSQTFLFDRKLSVLVLALCNRTWLVFWQHGKCLLSTWGRKLDLDWWNLRVYHLIAISRVVFSYKKLWHRSVHLRVDLWSCVGVRGWECFWLIGFCWQPDGLFGLLANRIIDMHIVSRPTAL